MKAELELTWLCNQLIPHIRLFIIIPVGENNKNVNGRVGELICLSIQAFWLDETAVYRSFPLFDLCNILCSKDYFDLWDFLINDSYVFLIKQHFKPSKQRTPHPLLIKSWSVNTAALNSKAGKHNHQHVGWASLESQFVYLHLPEIVHKKRN